MAPAPQSRDWHATLRQWSKPPSQTEDQRASNAASMIRDAIRNAAAFKDRKIDVYASGSYRNNTNARTESDVDVAVVLADSFFHELPTGLSPETLGFTNSTYKFNDFRTDVETALKAKFGRGVTVGDKAFDVHENSYRLDADVAVFFEHRRYTGKKNMAGGWHYLEGVEMRPRGNPSTRIVNWHQQHYDHGVAKNDETGRRFKRVVRILKRLRTEMVEEGNEKERNAASPIPSFLIECLVYNVPTEHFNQVSETYFDDTKAVVAWLWNRIHNDEHADFKEVSEMKWLFRSGQAWTPTQAKEFLGGAWNYVGFAN